MITFWLRAGRARILAMTAGLVALIAVLDWSVGNTISLGVLYIPGAETLRGRAIAEYLPVLADALRMDLPPEGFRTAAQCQGRRENGEIFLAHTWFSSYASERGTRLAAIVVDTSEEMREREEQNLQQLLVSNRIIAAAVSHELRNLCGAVSLV